MVLFLPANKLRALTMVRKRRATMVGGKNAPARKAEYSDIKSSEKPTRTSGTSTAPRPPGMARDGGEKGRSAVRDTADIAAAEAFLLELDIKPQPKQRHRVYFEDKAMASAFQRAAGDVRKFMALVKTQVMRAITPRQTRQFEDVVRIAAMAAMNRQSLAMFTGPVAMVAVFCFSGDAGVWPTAHADGDLDNLEKSLKDALIGVVYADDRLVVKKQSIKICGEKDGIFVSVRAARPPRLVLGRQANRPTHGFLSNSLFEYFRHDADA